MGGALLASRAAHPLTCLCPASRHAGHRSKEPQHHTEKPGTPRDTAPAPHQHQRSDDEAPPRAGGWTGLTMRARAHTRDQDRIAQQPAAARRPPPSSTTAEIVALPVIHSRMIRPQQCGNHQPGSHQGTAYRSHHSLSNSGRHRGRNSHRTHPPSSKMPDPGSGGAQANAVPGSRSISPRIRRASRDQDVVDACRHTTLSPSTEPRAREQ
mgnify:CR=1 FL=1